LQPTAADAILSRYSIVAAEWPATRRRLQRMLAGEESCETTDSMALLTLAAVPAEEAAPPYKDYLAAFPDGRVGIHLQAQVGELEALCAGLTESGAMFRYAEGKWTIKEVIGHLLDAERVFAYRLLRISRGDATELPGFDETIYAPEGQFNVRSVKALVSEFTLQRASTLALVDGIPPAAWLRVGTANGFRTSARALVYIILGHTAHHCRILRERYRLPATR
jgi:DinB family protein